MQEVDNIIFSHDTEKMNRSIVTGTDVCERIGDWRRKRERSPPGMRRYGGKIKEKEIKKEKRNTESDNMRERHGTETLKREREYRKKMDHEKCSWSMEHGNVIWKM